MDSDTFKSVSIVIVGLVTRLDNLCKLLIKKGVISEDDIKQLNSDTAKEVDELLNCIRRNNNGQTNYYHC